MANQPRLDANGKRIRANPPKHRHDKPKRHNKIPGTEISYCGATTNAGHSCSNVCPVVLIKGRKYKLTTCSMHASIAIRTELGIIGGKRAGAGRKRAKSPVEILQERFEADADRYLKPIEEALKAIKPIVVGNGAHARVVEYADAQARLKAMEMLLDRAFGKPKQVTEFSGPGGEAIEVSVPSDKDRQMDVAKVLAEVGALGPALVIPQNDSANEPSNN